MGRSAHFACMLSMIRRLRFPFWLAGVRLLRRRERFLLVAAGMAAAAAMLAAVYAGAVAAQDRDVGKHLRGISADSRSIHVTWFSVGGQAAPYSTLDGHVRRVLGHVTSRPATATSLYRESQLGGAFLGLGAVDDLGRWVHLRSGRLPRPCTPARCEVLESSASMATADGARLATRILRPADASARRGAVLIRSERPLPASGARSPVERLARWLAEDGRTVAIQTCRGRGDSEGEFRAFADEAADGGVALRWMADQPWFDGELVLLGAGYSAFTAWAALSAATVPIAAFDAD